MQVTKTVKETRDLIKNWKREGKTIGLVPTMGFLHEGHASLIKRCREENDTGKRNAGWSRNLLIEMFENSDNYSQSR